MKENKNEQKIMIANIIKMISIIILPICVWSGLLIIKAGEVYSLTCIFILIFADIAAYCIMELWRKRIIFVKCDIQAQEKYILSLLKRKRYVKDVTLHIELLGCRLLLGKYDDVKQEIDELSRMDSSLKPEQRLLLQLCKFEYLISLNETLSLNAELENLENDLLKLRGKNDRIKKTYLRGVRLCQYLIEEQWEDALEFFKEASKENIMICGQIITAYYCGKCCYHLGRYEEAFYKFKFAAKYGGNTKYVALANEMIEKIPYKNLYENKNSSKSIKVKQRADVRAVILAGSCLLVILSIVFNRYCSQGKSIEEAYRRRYFCAQDGPDVLYQDKIGSYELVILYDGINVAYCLIEETDSDYRIVESCRLEKNLEKNQAEPIGIELTESEKEIYQGSRTSGEIWMVLESFYKQNKIFYQEDTAYVGICSFPIAENVVVNGIPVSIEQVIYIDDAAVYLWSVENIDLNTIISVEYAAE